MPCDPHDTIAAISSPPGGAARGILRISGPATLDIVARCFNSTSNDEALPTRHAIVSRGRVDMLLNDSRQSIPCDLFLWPNNRSYTLEPVAEFHSLGSPPILNALLTNVCRAGARRAEPGEFTLRAFLAGRLDLTQAEAVLGVIDAHDARHLDTALRQLAGGLAQPLHRLREDLLQLLAELEAGLDFVEDDIEFISRRDLQHRLAATHNELEGVSAQLSTRFAASQLPRVVLFGRPNAGKSTLFNALTLSATQAIVSPRAGTTRDYLSATLDLGPIQCELVDTAGVEHVMDSSPTININTQAQAHACALRDEAVLRVLCIDATSPDAESWLAAAPRAADADQGLADLIVITKSDVAAEDPKRFAARLENVPVVITSGVTGAGLPQLRARLMAALDSSHAELATSCVATTADRCRDSIRLAAAAINRAREVAHASGGEELIAAELRGALTELGKVVGTVYTDDILDRIFSSFCIGK